MTDELKLLTEEQAGVSAQVSKWTIRRLIERGVLKASNYGTTRHKVYRIHPDDLRAVQLPLEMPRVARVGTRGRKKMQPSSGPLWPPQAA